MSGTIYILGHSMQVSRLGISSSPDVSAPMLEDMTDALDQDLSQICFKAAKSLSSKMRDDGATIFAQRIMEK